MMPHVVSCRLHSYGKHMDLGWTHLPTLGIRHVEIPIPAADGIEDVRRRLGASHLTVASFQGTFDINHPEVLEALSSQCETCAAFGVSRLFLSVKAGELDRSVAYDRLRAAGDRAARRGVILILETHPDLVTNGDIGAQTMRGVDHPHVRLNFDTANIYYYNQNTDAVTELRKVLPWVEGVHLKETDGGYQKYFFPALGQGVVDFPSVVRLLIERGYSGPFTMELEGTKGVEMTAEQQLAYVAESAAYLRRIGLLV